MPGIRNTTLIEALAEEVKARRAALGITQRELADRSGVGHVFIARVESCVSQPTVSAMVEISQGLSCHPDVFFTSVWRRYKQLAR